MEKSESIKELAAALAIAQGQMPAVPMGSVNPFLKNKYANLGDVIKTAQPILAKNGLSYSQSVYTEGPLIGVETILMHASGEWMSSKMAIHPGDEKGLSSAQSAGKVITYLRRYTLSAILGVYADEDADGNQGGQEQRKPQPQNQQRQPEPAKVQPAPSPAPVATTPKPAEPPAPILDADRVGPLTIALVLELKLTENEFSARNMFKAFGFVDGKTPAAEALPKIRKYRALKDSGKMTSAEAVAEALK